MIAIVAKPRNTEMKNIRIQKTQNTLYPQNPDYVDEEDKRGKLLQMIANVANHEWVACEKSIIHKTSNSG